MAAKKRKQKQTLKEFRAWLEGVEELQPDNWAPNREQWARIRARIDGIKEEPVAKTTPAPTPAANITNQPAPAPVIQPFYQQPPASLMAPAPASSIPAGEIEISPAARQMLDPGPGGKAKTPDIDTSDGNVESPFA